MRKTIVCDIFPTLALPILRKFIAQDLAFDEIMSTARIFYNLSHDVPICAYFPMEMVDIMKSIIESGFLGQYREMKTNLISCDKFSRHFSAFLDPFIGSSNLSIALNFVVHIVNEVSSLAEVPPEDEVEMPLTYNPPRLGRAYYFRKSGLQVRRARKFTMDIDHDKPSLWSCTKHYPRISRKGQTMLFLFFCPSHGHCYGFHIVNGSEGHKDPSQALYTHLPTAPIIIFYDNACQF